MEGQLWASILARVRGSIPRGIVHESLSLVYHVPEIFTASLLVGLRSLLEYKYTPWEEKAYNISH